MSAAEEPIGPTGVCGHCSKEISHAEGMTPEGQEYALLFCGFECYEQWLEKNNDSKDQNYERPE